MAKALGKDGIVGDWSPETYGRFKDLRLRPALDLLARVPALPEKGRIIDLGCGSGAVAEALNHRYPKRKLVGVDGSPAMLKKAAATGAYDRCDLADISVWDSNKQPALIFSNAALQWLGDHGALLPRLAGMLRPGGVLAVQMPRQYGAPSHRFLREFAAEMFPDRFDLERWQAPVASPTDYARMLGGLGALDIWQTDYVQRLEREGDIHPVRRFTEATAMRPFLEKLDEAEAARFVKRYDAALEAAYPAEADGSVLFPFRRVFIVLQVR